MQSARVDSSEGARAPFLPRARRGAILAVALAAALPAFGCSRSEPATAATATTGADQQAIVERAASALTRVRDNPRFSAMEFYLQRARGVLIFPRLVKASLIFGGEGGNGVFVARKADGSWSEPAFYSLGSPSVGLQIGYQEATVVLLIMDDATLRRTLVSNVELGAKAGVTLGNVGDRGSTEGDVVTENIYQVVDARGVFAGVSLDGYVIGARAKHNLEYYGVVATPNEILVQGKVHRAGSDVLRRALAPRAAADPALSRG